MATKKNKLTTVFDGDDKPFQKKIKRVQGSVKKTTGMLKGMGMAIGTAGIVAGISKTIQHFDRLGKIATRLDMSAEALQRLGHAANLSGSNMAQLQGIMTRLERRTGEALQNTTGSQAQRFKELNIEVENFSKLNPEDKILAIADAFNALGGTEKSVASLMGLLDTEVRELLPLLKEGSDGIQKMMRDVSALTDEQVKAMEQAADNIQKFKQWSITQFGEALGTIMNFPKTLQAGIDIIVDKNLEFPSWRTREDHDAFAYGSMLRTDKERELMRKHQTGQLDVARNREAYQKRETKERKDRSEQRMAQTPSVRSFASIRRQMNFEGLKWFGKGGGTVGSWGRQLREPYSKSLSQFDFKNALTGATTYFPERAKLKAEAEADLLEAISKDKATSSTSGRFGEFVAAATLGAGQGRMVSQRRGIRIEGIDKQTRILEDLRKHLDELAGNTTP